MLLKTYLGLLSWSQLLLFDKYRSGHTYIKGYKTQYVPWACGIFLEHPHNLGAIFEICPYKTEDFNAGIMSLICTEYRGLLYLLGNHFRISFHYNNVSWSYFQANSGYKLLNPHLQNLPPMSEVSGKKSWFLVDSLSSKQTIEMNVFNMFWHKHPSLWGHL